MVALRATCGAMPLIRPRSRNVTPTAGARCAVNLGPMKRDEMLRLLRKIKKPYVEDAGVCVAGFDLDVATADGAGTACWSWGSREVEGPTRLAKALCDRVAAYDRDSDEDPPEDFNDDELGLYRAMISAKCKPGLEYYHVLSSEDGGRFFSISYDKVFEEWSWPAVENAELTPWADMKDEELGAWVTRLGLKPERPRRERRAKPHKTARSDA
jgi:hypothetical protein